MNLQKPYLLPFVLSFVVIFLSAWFVKRPSIGPATFSPDGQYLVFSVDHKGTESIYRVRKDGTELTRLTSSAGRDFDPVYSPDGSKIVFARVSSMKEGSDADLYIMNSDGSSQSRLTTGPAHDVLPAFSPNGQRVYFVRARWFGHHSPFVSSRWHDMDLYSISLNGIDLKQITDEWCYEMSRPSVSQDGNQLLVRLLKGEDPDSLWIIPLENPGAMTPLRPQLVEYTGIRKRRESLYEYLYDPQFSSDGKSIVFRQVAGTSDQGYYEYEVYLMDLESKDVKKLTNLKSYTASPSFSPDGKEIIFLFDPKWPKRDSPYELWIVNADGTNPRKIPLNLDQLP